jgi:hypothetical protein
MITYDPLAALGIRIGTPLQDAFLDEHVKMLADEFGAAFVSAIRQALDGDLPAAWRVADILAPASVFTIGDVVDGYISASYVCFGYDGRVKMATIPPMVLSQAMVLVVTAITVHSEVRRGTDHASASV